jgi:predicted RNase H-like HicB family nuclease
MKTFRFPAIVKVDRAGFYLVTFPDVPEAGTDAPTRMDALYEAMDALIAALGGLLRTGNRFLNHQEQNRTRS